MFERVFPVRTSIKFLAHLDKFSKHVVSMHHSTHTCLSDFRLAGAAAQ